MYVAEKPDSEKSVGTKERAGGSTAGSRTRHITREAAAQ